MWTAGIGIALALVGWLVGTAVQWGALGQRIRAVENEVKKKVDHSEYQVGYQNIIRRLDSIETKLDRNYRSGGR